LALRFYTKYRLRPELSSFCRVSVKPNNFDAKLRSRNNVAFERPNSSEKLHAWPAIFILRVAVNLI
jgi:hypothetical protein